MQRQQLPSSHACCVVCASCFTLTTLLIDLLLVAFGGYFEAFLEEDILETLTPPCAAAR